MLTESLDLFFSDFAATLVANEETAIPCLFDENFDEFLDETTAGRSLIATVKRTDSDLLNYNDSVTINGISYLEGRNFEITGIRPIEDGAICEIDLKELP